MATHSKILETKISKVAQQQVSTRSPTGIFLGKPQLNPKGHVNAITLQSGKELEVVANKRGEGKDT